MARAGTAPNHDRLKAGLAAGVLQVGLVYGLIVGLNVDMTSVPNEVLKVYDILQDPPTPPPEPILPERTKTDEEEGAAAPPNLRARPTPVVAPPTPIPVRSKIVASPAPSPVDGPDASAGASARPGPGTGAGGVGTGTGSGGAGTGSGSGGGSEARRVRGALSFERDYPRAARAIRAEGRVFVRIGIAADGRVSGCTITRSSGNGDLDRTTCRLIVQRFRYAPARDQSGQPIAATESTSFDWRLLP
ncbi:MAG: energy transducer TonB [Sphingosinicella sp.]|nr:energy transducer TonB [Sphingosinicella sp.]